MQKLFKYLLGMIAVSAIIVSCDKKNDLPFYVAGNQVELTTSAATLAPPPADSNKTVLTLNWTYPNHATDSANIKYTIEMDSTTKGFANPSTKVVAGTSSASYIAKELNNILLARGYAFNVPVDMDVRLITSYANNNERIVSNVIKIRMTPYKVPPKIALPASGKLFIVGSATDGSWDNPVSVPRQEFARINETTFGGIFNLKGGQFYILLPENGLWDKKYAIANNTASGASAGGDFLENTGQDIPSPAADGLYKITVDFQTGKYSVTAFTQQHGLPTELFMVGDATPGSWSNPVPVPSQQFTRLNAVEFQINSLAMPGGGNYLFLPTNGMWDRKFGAVDNTAPGIKLGGILKPEGQDMPGPETAGNYRITVNFFNNTYKVVKL